MLRELFRHAGALLREKRLLWLTLILIALTGVLLLLPRDPGWARYWFSQRTAASQRIANAVSCWGDFPRGWLILIAFIFGVGWVRKKTNWRVVALATLLAGLSAGLQVHIVRYTVGRARPSTGMNGDFYGPNLERAFHSFPSAHTTCAFAVATALVVTMPVIGVPALLVAALVGWSRLALTAHYPTDVWLGMWFGVVNGLVFGLAARRLLKGTG